MVLLVRKLFTKSFRRANFFLAVMQGVCSAITYVPKCAQLFLATHNLLFSLTDNNLESRIAFIGRSINFVVKVLTLFHFLLIFAEPQKWVLRIPYPSWRILLPEVSPQQFPKLLSPQLSVSSCFCRYNMHPSKSPSIRDTRVSFPHVYLMQV